MLIFSHGKDFNTWEGKKKWYYWYRINGHNLNWLLLWTVQNWKNSIYSSKLIGIGPLLRKNFKTWHQVNWIFLLSLSYQHSSWWGGPTFPIAEYPPKNWINALQDINLVILCEELLVTIRAITKLCSLWYIVVGNFLFVLPYIFI